MGYGWGSGGGSQVPRGATVSPTRVGRGTVKSALGDEVCWGGSRSNPQAGPESVTMPTTGVVRGTVKRAHAESSP